MRQSSKPARPRASARYRSRWAPLAAAIVASSVASVLVAALVTWTTLPTEEEIQRRVASELGVPRAALEIPMVSRMLDNASARARQAVIDASRQSLVLGTVAGAVTSVVLACAVSWRATRERRIAERSPSTGEHIQGDASLD